MVMEQNFSLPNVLVVEDDAICAFLAESILKKYYTITIVTNGFAALEVIKDQRFDVILMDINLNNAEMDGIKTMRTIRYNRKHNYIKIIAVTASANDKDWFLKLGFDGQFLKPVLEEKIIPVIQKYIKRKIVVPAKPSRVSIQYTNSCSPTNNGQISAQP